MAVAERYEMPMMEPEPSGLAAPILVVDDRPENLVALEAVLEPLGERVVRAESGDDALRCVLKEEFALILLDANMPEMSGIETAELIRSRKRSRHIPIIFITAYSKDREQVFEGYSVGAVDYITKPYDPDILRSKVKVFVELFRRGEEIKRQQQLLREIEAREAEQRRIDQAAQLEQEHMRLLNQELEARVLERTSQLRTANEELEAFCYSVSHDLRAPLRAIMATSRILLEEANGKLETEERDCLARQAHNANRLGALIDDLLNLSRIGRRSIDPKEVDLTAMAREVAAEVRGRGWANPPRILVQSDLSVVADPGLVRAALSNLLDNACKYSPEGGRVRVGQKMCDAERVFFVRDQGIGFEPKYAPKIFLPFERLVHDDEYPGTGIGLANVQRIVRRHGGRIWVESEPGQGTTFYFTFGDGTGARSSPGRLV